MICFRIFERHYVIGYDENNTLTWYDKKDGWVRITYCFDPAEKTISDFQEHPLFDDENEFVTKATKVNFFDGTSVICCNSIDWFINNVLPEYNKSFKNNDTDNQSVN